MHRATLQFFTLDLCNRASEVCFGLATITHDHHFGKITIRFFQGDRKWRTISHCYVYFIITYIANIDMTTTYSTESESTAFVGQCADAWILSIAHESTHENFAFSIAHHTSDTFCIDALLLHHRCTMVGGLRSKSLRWGERQCT